MVDLSTVRVPISAREIQEILPHRYPFLLLDCISYIDDKVIEGYKNITINEPFFPGHFPGNPIMPGVLMVEALAQLGSCQLMLAKGKPPNKIGIFAGIDKLKFRHPVYPGDKLDLRTELIWERGDEHKSVGKSTATASVNGKIAVTGELMFALVDRSTLQ